MTDLARAVSEVQWFHTIELPNGIVTPGLFDTRETAKRIPLPESLAGMRCLDVGTADGFWAFEMERRGAAEVVAIDIVDPAKRDVTVGAAPGDAPGSDGSFRQARAFEIAHAALNSRVDMRPMSVYDLDPDVVGKFDFVFMGNILVHLRDPVLALMKVQSVTAGRLMTAEAVSRSLSLWHPRMPAARLTGLTRSNWWHPNVACLHQFLRAAGFEIEKAGKILYVDRRKDRPPLRQVLRHPFFTAMLYLGGVPETWVISRPKASDAKS